MREALLLGDGLAIAACRELLVLAGWKVGSGGGSRPKLPSVLLNGASQQLLQDVFRRSDLLEGLHRIERRFVRWGGRTVELPHQALAASEAVLLERIGVASDDGSDSGYTIYGRKPLPGDAKEASYGARVAEALEFELVSGAPRDACWVEAVESGWMFAVCSGADKAWMLAIGASVEELLEQSELLRKVVGTLGRERRRFDSHPRIALHLSGEGWLACGGAAMSFDPICGEGVGHALREAILATAVMKAHERGEPWDVLTRLYEQRLRAGFQRHLEQCRQLYASGADSEWWRAQLASIVHDGMPPADPVNYRLEGFDLVLIKPA